MALDLSNLASHLPWPVKMERSETDSLLRVRFSTPYRAGPELILVSPSGVGYSGVVSSILEYSFFLELEKKRIVWC